MAFWVYILKCSDGSYYTGHTEDMETRLGQHIHGHFPTCYTFRRRPVALVYSEQLGTRLEARKAERHIKGWSRRKKQALVAGDSEALARLARRGGSSY
jgi:predicted GIY-YIG superfamily endonuclease